MRWSQHCELQVRLSQQRLAQAPALRACLQVRLNQQRLAQAPALRACTLLQVAAAHALAGLGFLYRCYGIYGRA